MKIICTKKEKEQMIASILTAEYCPSFMEKINNCKPVEGVRTCLDCLNKYIDWEVTDEH